MWWPRIVAGTIYILLECVRPWMKCLSHHRAYVRAATRYPLGLAIHDPARVGGACLTSQCRIGRFNRVSCVDTLINAMERRARCAVSDLAGELRMRDFAGHSDAGATHPMLECMYSSQTARVNQTTSVRAEEGSNKSD